MLSADFQGLETCLSVQPMPRAGSGGRRRYQRWATGSRPLLAHLRPGSGFPRGRAGHSVAGPAALRAMAAAVLGMDRAVPPIGKGLKATHGAQLVARVPTGFCAVLPLVCRPAGEGKKKKIPSQLLPVIRTAAGPGSPSYAIFPCRTQYFWVGYNIFVLVCNILMQYALFYRSTQYSRVVCNIFA